MREFYFETLKCLKKILEVLLIVVFRKYKD